MRDRGRGARALTVGDAVPECRLPALAATVGSGWEFDTGWLRGRWVALVYWPRPSSLDSIHEVAELVRSSPVYAERDTLFVAVTGALETEPGRANVHPRLPSDLPFPVLVDVRGELAQALGLDALPAAGSVRASLVADPQGIVRWTSLSELSGEQVVREAAHALSALRGVGAVDNASAARRLIRACAWCRRLEDECGWQSAETYIRRRTGADLTHGICEDCLRQQSPR
jgi:peroxiredoxin (alkyl hydroperoxide reductase subunit C)